MIIDKDQNFFIGTHLHGLVIRTNNNDWRNYTKTNSLLPDNQILALSKDSSGNLWVGTYSEGLVRFKEGYLGLGELKEMKLQIYPIPATQNQDVTILLPDPETFLIITDQQGRIVLQEHTANTKVTLPYGLLKPGSYQVSAITSHERFTRILVIL